MYVVFNSFDKAENVDCKRINSLFGTEIEQLSFCVKTLLKLRENMQNNDLILFFYTLLPRAVKLLFQMNANTSKKHFIHFVRF